jgi:nucleoside-diphosphate-sugar epimerase
LKITIVGQTDPLTATVTGYLTAWGHEVVSVNPEQLPRQSGIGSTLIVMPGLALTQVENVVESLAPTSARLVFAGSMTVYRAWARYTRQEPGPPDLVPLLESDPLFIGSQQVLAEEVVQNSPAPVTILRLPDVFGPGISNPRFSDPLSAMDAGTSSIPLQALQGEWRLATAFTQDVAYGIALAAKNSKAAGRIYNIADSFAFTQIDWINAIGRAANWNGQVIENPASEDITVDYSQHLILDSSNFRRDFGYSEQTPINEAFRATVAWERQNNSPDRLH